jgi:hypothetical protein
MFAVPTLTPVIRPLAACTFAMALALLLQVPPGKPTVSEALVWPTHTVASPVIVLPLTFTDTIAVRAQLPVV